MAFPLIPPKSQWVDSNGDPLVGGTLEFQDPATSAAKDTYPTYDNAEAQSNPNTNPVVLDSRGEAAIFLRDGESYKVIAKDADGATVWTVDDVFAPASGAASSTSITDAGGYYAASNVEAALQELGASTGAAIIGVADAGGNFTATDVEAALAEIVDDLASTSNGNGASKVAIEDAGTLYDATTVEAALAEVARRNMTEISGGAFWNSDTTLSNATSTIPLEGSTLYAVSGVIWGYENGGGLKWALTPSLNPVDSGYLYWRAYDQTGVTNEGISANIQTIKSLTAMTNGDEFVLRFEGRFNSNASGGTIVMQGAQVSSSANSTHIRPGSYITVKKYVL